MADTATITLTITDAPARSKQAGPCWFAAVKGSEHIYATAGGRTVTVKVGDTVLIKHKVTLRRATRTQQITGADTLRVTGDPADVVDLSVGSPQSLDVSISGVVLI